MLQAYLNQNEPLTAYVSGQAIKLKNLNTLTAYELNEAVKAVRTKTKTGDVISLLILEDENEVMKTLTPFKGRQLFKAWEEQSGITLQQLVSVFDLIEYYPTELQTDLGLFTNIKSISELLTLPAIDMVTVTTGLLTHINRKSHIITKAMKLSQPFSPEQNNELLLWTIVNILRNFVGKEAISLDTLMLKTDKENDGLKPLSEGEQGTEEEIKLRNERLTKWRKTGTLD